ncbi:MAG: PrsW family glutamic-type intramembrane protease [Chloroflexota bacterium]
MSPLAQVLLFALSLLIAAVTTLIYIWLIWRADRYEKEPKRLLVAAFVWGAVPAIVLSVVMGSIVGPPAAALAGGYAELVTASFVAPPVEEAAKALALAIVYAGARNEFDGVLDGIVYGSLVGLGFALTENVFYFVDALATEDLGSWSMVVLGRTTAFGLNHAMFTAFTGVGLGLARFTRSRARRWLLALTGLAAAILAHLLHNLLLHMGDLCLLSLLADWAGLLVLLVIVLIASERERAWIRAHLADEVAIGVLTADLAQRAASRRAGWQSVLQAWGASGVRAARLWRQLLQAAAELAIKKQQQAKGVSRKDSADIVAAHRATILRIRQRLGDPEAAYHVACQECGRPVAQQARVCPHCAAPQNSLEGG